MAWRARRADDQASRADEGSSAGRRTEPEAARILRLQRAAGNRATRVALGRDASLQRDTALAPPSTAGDAASLAPEQVVAAVAFNTARFNAASTRAITDVVGTGQDGFDEDAVQAIARWQADWNQTVDGKVGVRTLRTIVRELIAEGERNRPIRLIIDGHDMRTRGLTSIRFDPSVTSNAVTSGPIPGNSSVRVGPAGFSRGYEGLVHTIAHELEHVRQRRIGMTDQPTREFLGEAVEIVSSGMLDERIDSTMDDARRALRFWNRMPVAAQRTHFRRLEQVRRRLHRRLDRAPAATRARHAATLAAYDALTRP